MFDLDEDRLVELEDFTAIVRERLRAFASTALVTEHGRVAACVSSVLDRHDPHCLHAHRLVFPGQGTIDLSRWMPALQVERFASSQAAARLSRAEGQYLYVEQPDATCQVAAVTGRVPRQFLRAVVAAEQRRPELADWRTRPAHRDLDAARAVLDARVDSQVA